MTFGQHENGLKQEVCVFESFQKVFVQKYTKNEFYMSGLNLTH